MGRHLLKYGSGRTVRNSNRLLPWGAKFVHEARLRVSVEVARVRVGNRILDVPEHGHVVVVWGRAAARSWRPRRRRLRAGRHGPRPSGRTGTSAELISGKTTRRNRARSASISARLWACHRATA